MTSSEEFQHHFSIISKFVCCVSYMKRMYLLALISFAVLKWDECLSVQLPFELPVQIPVQLLLELKNKLTRSKCEWTWIWTTYNVDETTPNDLKWAWYYFVRTKSVLRRIQIIIIWVQKRKEEAEKESWAPAP